MTFFRRRKPLHQRLLEQAGLEVPQADARPVVGGTREPGVHGIARQREWDAVATVEAPDISGDELSFDVLPDRTVLVDEEEGDAPLAPLADAVERELVTGDPGRLHGRDSVPFTLACDSVDTGLTRASNYRARIGLRHLETRLLEQPLMQRLAPPEKTHG